MKLSKVILAPDSFKGTMSAEEVCRIWSGEIDKTFPQCSVLCVPMSDGGEGMVSAYIRILKGTVNKVTVCGPLGEKTEAAWALLNNGTAVMEMAQAAGLTLVKGRNDILKADTFGVGEMILGACGHGVTKIIIGIGGSATNDCGSGMAYAMGYRFLASGREVRPEPGNLKDITEIKRPEYLPKVQIITACDVDNPLTGPEGATAVFGPQKGADSSSSSILEEGLENMMRLMKSDLGRDVSKLKGAGAAGGLGAGLYAFMDSELVSGVNAFLDAADFDSLLDGCDLVITGEGKIDGQSIHGKVPVGVAARAKRKGVPCIALCGSAGDDAEKVYDYGINSIFTSVCRTSDFAGVEKTCRDDMRMLIRSVLNLIKIV
jgi:glycerate kinase